MTAPVLTIGGPPGSGKSTAGRRVAAERGLEYVSAGEIFRAEARRRGISLADLGALAERDDTIDRALDDEMVRRADPSRLLDGRVTGPILRRRGVATRYLVVTASPEVRWGRLANRDGGTVAEARSATLAREASERRRYHLYYGIDLDTEAADLSIDSTSLGPDEVVGRILEFLGPVPSTR